MKLSWYMRALVIGVGSALLLTSLGAAAASDDDSLARVKKNGTVTVCTSNDVPYAYKDLSTGEAVGTDIDMVTNIFKRLGVPKVEIYSTPFSSLIPALQASRCDLIADNMGISVERSKQVSFSSPMYVAGVVLVVPKGNPSKVTSVDKFGGKRVAAYLGTLQVDWLKKLAEKDPTITVKTFKSIPEIVAEFRAGRLDAAVVDGMSSAYMLKTDPSIPMEIVDYKLPVGDYAVGAAFRIEDKSLRHAFDDAKRQGELDGDLSNILNKWNLRPVSSYVPFVNCCTINNSK